MNDLRAALAHVLWIGGGPQAGKSTLSRLLAGTWDLRRYDLDWRGSREHGERSGPRARAFAALTMDERWARPEVDDLVERSRAIWDELFALVIEDLLALPRTCTIVAEGPGALPWSVAPLISTPRQAIFLVPTREWRAHVAERRWGPGQAMRFPGIVDRTSALANVAERDARMDARIAAACAELGLRCVAVDGTQDIGNGLALLEEHFRPQLPTTPNA